MSILLSKLNILSFFTKSFISEKFEVGIVLTGTEIKSIRLGNVNLKDSYASIDHGELFINNMHKN